MNPMKNIRIEKITLNVGAGKDQKMLEKGSILLKNITGIEPVKTVTKKRIPTWGLRPGLPIGCKITIRGKKAEDILADLLKANENKLTEKQFDSSGNIAFGIREYIDVPSLEYDPKIGIIGFEVCVTLKRPGFRVKRRFLKKRKVGKNHVVKKEDAIGFMKSKFSVNMEEEE